MSETRKVGICGLIERIRTIKGDINAMTTNSTIGTAKTNVDNLITNINSDGWMLDPTSSAITQTNTYVDATFSGVPGSTITNLTFPSSGDLQTHATRFFHITSGSTDAGFSGTVQNYSANTTTDWFTGWTRTPGTTSYTGIGMSLNITSSTQTVGAVLSGTVTGTTTKFSASAIGFQQQLDEGINRLRVLSTQLTTIQSQKSIHNTLPFIKQGMVEELERISLIMREGSNWGVFPFDCGGREGLSGSERRIEKEFRKSGVKLTGGQVHRRG